MYTALLIYFENIQYYNTEFNIVQKLKGTNKVGVTPPQVLRQNKIRTTVKKLRDLHFII